jgi:hypothetical protein
MTEAQALETLKRQDPDAAGDAKAALGWLTGDQGLQAISQLQLQEFLWYALPVKWPMTTAEHIAVANALGRLLTLAGLERYAEVCTSAATEKILTAYSHGHEAGIASYTEAVEDSNAAPPDTELLAWGSVMGPDERTAYDACAAALELATAAGELRVGARGWKTKRAALVDRWLGQQLPGGGRPDGGHPAGPRLSGAHAATDTWLRRIGAERIDAWAQSRPGERTRLARAIVPQLLKSPAPPEDPLPTLGWLLSRAGGGLRLTARHYIAPALVTEAVDTFGWRDQLIGSVRQELNVFPLHTLRGLAQAEMGAIRRNGSSLVLTKTGKLMTDDKAARWRIGTAALIGPDDGPRPDFCVAVREAALLVLLTDGPASYSELTEQLTCIHGREGWHSRGGTDLTEAVRAEVYNLRHRLWALQLLASERAFAAPLTLTETGISAALCALLSRALRPRHHIGLG